MKMLDDITALPVFFTTIIMMKMKVFPQKIKAKIYKCLE